MSHQPDTSDTDGDALPTDRDVGFCDTSIARSETTYLVLHLLQLCERQASHEMASGYDIDIGLHAVARAKEAIESVQMRSDPDAYMQAIIDVLFALLEEFRTRGPRGEYASAASSLGSLILALGNEMSSVHSAAAAEIARRWQVV